VRSKKWNVHVAVILDSVREAVRSISRDALASGFFRDRGLAWAAKSLALRRI
jgi:hypothetical protein